MTAPTYSPPYPKKLSASYTERHQQLRDLSIPDHLADSPAFTRAVNECLAVIAKSAAHLTLADAARLLGHYAPSPALRAIATKRFPRDVAPSRSRPASSGVAPKRCDRYRGRSAVHTERDPASTQGELTW